MLNRLYAIALVAQCGIALGIGDIIGIGFKNGQVGQVAALESVAVLGRRGVQGDTNGLPAVYAIAAEG